MILGQSNSCAQESVNGCLPCNNLEPSLVTSVESHISKFGLFFFERVLEREPATEMTNETQDMSLETKTMLGLALESAQRNEEKTPFFLCKLSVEDSVTLQMVVIWVDHSCQAMPTPLLNQEQQLWGHMQVMFCRGLVELG